MNTYQNTKPTNIAWLGEVPSHWEVYPLWTQAKPKSIINKIYEPLLSVYLDKGVIPFDEVQEKRTNVTSLDLSKYQFVEIGDFVLNNQQAWRGSVGVSKYQGIVSPAYLVLSLSDNLNRNFANYLFRNGAMVAHYLISSRGVGTIQRNLYWGQLKNTPLFLPPLSEQTAIANFLDKKTAQIKEAIALKSEQITKLKEYRQTLINQTVTQGLNPSVAMKNSGVEWFGEIPSHWEVSKLGRILKPFSEKNHAHLPLLSITRELGIIERDVENQDENHNFIPDDLSGYKLLKKGQFGMNKMKAWQGSYGVSPYTGIVSPAYFIFDFAKEINPNFFHWAIRCKLYVSFFGSASDGVRIGQWDLSKSRMKEIPFVIPPLSEQIAIANFLDKKTAQIDTAISQYQMQIDKLKEYQQSLVNEAVTGKVKVI